MSRCVPETQHDKSHLAWNFPPPHTVAQLTEESSVSLNAEFLGSKLTQAAQTVLEEIAAVAVTLQNLAMWGKHKNPLFTVTQPCITTGTTGLCSQLATFLDGMYKWWNMCSKGMERTGILRCYHIGLTGFKEALFTIADTRNRVEPNWADGGKILQPVEPAALAGKRSGWSYCIVWEFHRREVLTAGTQPNI